MRHCVRGFAGVVCGVLLTFGLAAPASGTPAGARVIVIAGGGATVGKVISDSDGPNDGCDFVTGGGLGLPVLSQAKNAYFQLTAAVTVVNVSGAHVGALNVCGRLLPAMDNAIWVPGNTKRGIGASCGMSKGHEGMGLLEVPSKSPFSFWLTDVGWKASVGGLIPITGKIHSGMAKGKAPVDGVAGLLVASGGADCVAKRDNPKLDALYTGFKSTDGAKVFAISGIVVVVPDGAFLGNRNELLGSPEGTNDMPLLCKKDKKDPGLCLYKTKK